MVKFGVLLLLTICVQASLAKHGSRRHGESWKVRKWEGERVKGKDYTKMRDMSDMMMMKMRMKKMLEPLRVLFVKVLGLGSKETTPGKPKFCGDNECPEFKVLNKSKHYELRMYQPSQWVSTSMQVKTMNRQVIKKCFWRLFNYIQGNNELEQKIKMTVPVTNVFKKDPVSGKTNFTMSFFLPPTITDPPFPNDDEVSIKRKGNFRVYSHSFGGFAMSEKTWKKHAVMLEKMLNKDGLARKYYPHDEKYVTAGYDDPMKLFNRHNEVWLIAKNNED